MKYEVVARDEFKILGPSIKTTNKNMQSIKDQGKFWQNFFNDNLSEQILNKLDREILGLYTDYEGDYTKPYKFIIGYEVADFTKIPQGMEAKIIPASSYAVFTGKGKDNIEKVTSAWQQIWNSDIKRTYKFDFEVYDLSNPEADVKIYVGINKVI